MKIRDYLQREELALQASKGPWRKGKKGPPYGKQAEQVDISKKAGPIKKWAQYQKDWVKNPMDMEPWAQRAYKAAGKMGDKVASHLAKNDAVGVHKILKNWVETAHHENNPELLGELTDKLGSKFDKAVRSQNPKYYEKNKEDFED